VDFGDSSPWNCDVGCVGLCGEGVILVPLVVPFGEEGRRRGSRRFAILSGSGDRWWCSRGVSEVHKRQLETGRDRDKGATFGVFGASKFVAVTHLLIASFCRGHLEIVPISRVGNGS
jgi:hypothetical protein